MNYNNGLLSAGAAAATLTKDYMELAQAAYDPKKNDKQLEEKKKQAWDNASVLQKGWYCAVQLIIAVAHTQDAEKPAEKKKGPEKKEGLDEKKREAEKVEKKETEKKVEGSMVKKVEPEKPNEKKAETVEEKKREPEKKEDKVDGNKKEGSVVKKVEPEKKVP